MSVSSSEAVTGSSSFGVNSATGTTTGSSAASATKSTQVDKDMFLKLMVAQLKNQDPMNPQDSSEFLAQTAQFTSLEKLEAVASQSAQALSAQLAFGASGLVGKTVTYTDAAGAEQTGAVGSARFTSSGPILSIGGSDIPLGNVVSVKGATT